MNENQSWHNYNWNFRDLLQVLLPKVVSSCYLETILVIFLPQGRCLETYQSLPVPSDFGWQRSNNSDVPWEPVWITNGEASKEVREFVKCRCQGEASCVRCKCSSSNMVCTMLCNCTCTNRISYDN